MFCYLARKICNKLYKNGAIIRAETSLEKYAALGQKVTVEYSAAYLDMHVFSMVGICAGFLVPTTREDSFLKVFAGLAFGVIPLVLGTCIIPIAVTVRAVIAYSRNKLYYLAI